MGVSRKEFQDHLDLEYFLDCEGVDYKLSHGSSGLQINIQECPECADRRWKTYLNHETGRGNCFACDNTFAGKVDVVRQVLGLNWKESFKQAEVYLKEQGYRPKRSVTAAVGEPIAKLPTSFPLPTQDGRNLVYLEERGITNDLSAYFHLRYCELGWWNYDKPDGQTGGQNFERRVIIPIYDLDGKFVTFQGRDITGKAERKYLFPATLPGTGRFLFNGQNAHHTKRVALGEGVFDIIAMKKAFDEDMGLRDVVPIGSFGKHLSAGLKDNNDQLSRFIQLKSKGLQEVTIIWDGEEKALLSALDAAKLIGRIGLSVRIGLLPAGKDPNEVSGDIVCQTFREATDYSRMLHVRWKINNPYKNSSV